MKKTLLLVLFAGLSSFIRAQDFEWVQHFEPDSVSYAYIAEAETDAAGNVYATGHFAGTTDFDPGPGTVNLVSQGDDDFFISKTSASGNLIWVKRIGGSGEDRGQALQLDTSGNIYIS
jgi:hypothetical protein